MKTFLRSLPLHVEFTLVIGLAFGYFIFASISYALAPVGPETITNESLWVLMQFEIVVCLPIFWFLRQRQWRLDDFRLDPSLASTGYGIVLAIAVYAAYFLIWTAAEALLPGLFEMTRRPPAAGNLSLVTIFAVSIINPLYEELLVLGYVVTALRPVKGEAFAINTSVAIRLLYHLYQGPSGVLFIVPLGLICAYWYARKGRLWSVVTAHAIFDFIALNVNQ